MRRPAGQPRQRRPNSARAHKPCRTHPRTLYWLSLVSTNSWSNTAVAVKSGAGVPTRGACITAEGRRRAGRRSGELQGAAIGRRHRGPLRSYFSSRGLPDSTPKVWEDGSRPEQVVSHCSLRRLLQPIGSSSSRMTGA